MNDFSALSEILSFIGGVIIGIAGTNITISIRGKIGDQSKNKNASNQSGATAEGDIVGRDKITVDQEVDR